MAGSTDALSATGSAGISSRRSLVSGAAYALASAGQRAVSFLLVPVYAAALSPAEYGRLSLLATLMAAASVVFTGGLDFALVREYFRFEGDSSAQQAVVQSTWAFLMIVAPAAALLVSVPLLLVPGSSLFRPAEVASVLLAAALFVAATIVPLAVLRCDQRLRPYLAISGVTGVVTAIATVCLVVVVHMGVWGWIGSTVIANVATLVVAMRLVPWHWTAHLDAAKVRAALRLGSPLVPHALALWSLLLADRALLAAITTPAALGIYSLGANLAQPAMILVLAVNQGFMPTYARRRDAHDPGDLRDTISLQIGVISMITCAVALLGPAAVSVVAPASYSPAASLIPWFALGYLFLGVYCVPMNGITLMLGRTRYVWILTITSATVNLGLIAVLVPTYGTIAAAVASAAGYAVLLVSISAYAVKLGVPLAVDLKRSLGSVLIAGGTYLVGAVLVPIGDGEGLALRLLVVATLPLTVGGANGMVERLLRAGRRPREA